MKLRELLKDEQLRRRRRAGWGVFSMAVALSVACFIVCPQLGWGPDWFANWGPLALFESLGHRACLIACGAFYVAFVWSGLRWLTPWGWQAFVRHHELKLLWVLAGTSLTVLASLELASGDSLAEWLWWSMGLVLVVSALSRPLSLLKLSRI